ncbi:uncharacterized protein LOC133194239 [Saccostrea echinata]|uniref:uncharacterized protein LOC133194239 n=1 Tax=Saccostrea echinata TaxID=191078 RepID=UPI002A80D789|nr:uncharacterized protein LOC133194239 [Saccostrea echinata]
MTQIMEGTFSVRKSRRKLKLYECSAIIGAIYKNRHWTLVIVDPLKGVIHYFNPLKETRIQLEEIKRNWCLYTSERMLTYNEVETRNWAVLTREHSKQTDSFNRGMYCLIFAEQYFNQQPIDNVSNADLKRAREKIASSLMMYNVNSTDRCPCCGFLTYAEETRVYNRVFTTIANSTGGHLKANNRGVHVILLKEIT